MINKSNSKIDSIFQLKIADNIRKGIKGKIIILGFLDPKKC